MGPALIYDPDVSSLGSSKIYRDAIALRRDSGMGATSVIESEGTPFSVEPSHAEPSFAGSGINQVAATGDFEKDIVNARSQELIGRTEAS